MIFVTISSALFSDLESILVPKTSAKWRVLGSLFQPRCGYASAIFDLKRYIFQMFFQRCFQDVLFFDFRSKLGPNSIPNGSPNRLENQWKSNLNFWWNFAGFSVAPRGGGMPLQQTRVISMPSPKKHPQLIPGAPPGGSSWNLVELRLET